MTALPASQLPLVKRRFAPDPVGWALIARMAELAAKIPPLQDLIKTLARISLGLLGITVIAMATARYW